MKKLTSGYHPQSKQTGNQDLGRFLWVYNSDNQVQWAKVLSYAKRAQNSLKHTATNLKPFHCIFSSKLSLFLWNASSTETPTVDNWVWRSEQVWEQALNQRVCCAAQWNYFTSHHLRHSFPAAYKHGH